MTPPPTELNEATTREKIDQNLAAAGWVVQDKKRLNLHESLGVAVREMDTTTGPADYMLFVQAQACGVIEAKREGTPLGGVAEQSQRYAAANVPFVEKATNSDQLLPFLYEATNREIRFRDERDPKPRSRKLFHFHQPETLKAWLEEPDTLRARLQHLPALNTEKLRDCQIAAITGIENSLKASKPRALLQMATGSGKTYTAVTQVYRLAKFAKIKRALFLVDRSNLACAAITVNKDKVKREFTRIRLYENYEQTRKAASGGNQPNLNLSKVRDISLPLPSLEEQGEIVARVGQKFIFIKRLEIDLETQLLKAGKNKQSISMFAFSGRLCKMSTASN